MLSPQASSLHDAVNYPVDGNVRGLAFADANITSNRYLYNGKELEDYTLGTAYLGTLDYGAGHYESPIIIIGVLKTQNSDVFLQKIF